MIVVTHYQRLLELHRAGFRARAVRGPDREIGRQGTGAGAGRERVRRAGNRRRRGGGRQGMTAVAEQIGNWLEEFTGQPALRRGCRSCARRRSSALRSWVSPPRTTKSGASRTWRRSRGRSSAWPRSARGAADSGGRGTDARGQSGVLRQLGTILRRGGGRQRLCGAEHRLPGNRSLCCGCPAARWSRSPSKSRTRCPNRTRVAVHPPHGDPGGRQRAVHHRGKLLAARGATSPTR